MELRYPPGDNSAEGRRSDGVQPFPSPLFPDFPIRTRRSAPASCACRSCLPTVLGHLPGPRLHCCSAPAALTVLRLLTGSSSSPVPLGCSLSYDGQKTTHTCWGMSTPTITDFIDQVRSICSPAGFRQCSPCDRRGAGVCRDLRRCVGSLVVVVFLGSCFCACSQDVDAGELLSLVCSWSKPPSEIPRPGPPHGVDARHTPAPEGD